MSPGVLGDRRHSRVICPCDTGYMPPWVGSSRLSVSLFCCQRNQTSPSEKIPLEICVLLYIRGAFIEIFRDPDLKGETHRKPQPKKDLGVAEKASMGQRMKGI